MYKVTQQLKSYFFSSLIGRFIFASLLLLPIFIFISGTLLINSFKHSQLKAEQETLQTQLYLLLSHTEVENKQVILPDILTEPRFNQQNSGLYAAIYSDNDKELWRSPSAMLLNNDLNNDNLFFLVGNKQYSQVSKNKLTVNQLSHDIEWLDENNQVTRLRFIVASDNSSLKAEIISYQNRLWQWLSAMGASLVAIQIVIMQWGFRPLKRLSRQLLALQENKIQQLDKHYPKEIQPIINDFNTILTYEKNQRERYHNTMSDLAHSLKTPLAVIQSQIQNQVQSQVNSNDELYPIINEQLARINQIINHQLKRAVIRVNQSAISTQTDKVSIKVITDRLIKTLCKIYIDKQIVFKNLVKEEHLFFGDEADLLEVMGNLLDNACKYGHNAITIMTKKDAHTLSIYISDNGKGLSKTKYSTLLKRGARGDTAQTGQGIGLSVAVDIISSYKGGLTVNNNLGKPHLSGTCFCITLPTYITRPTSKAIEKSTL